MGTSKDPEGKKRNRSLKLRNEEGKEQITGEPNQLRKTEMLRGSLSHPSGRGFWDRAGRELNLMPATLNGLNSDSEDNDLTSEEDEENHSDPEEATSSSHTLHPRESRSRNGNYMDFQRVEVGAFRPILEACGVKAGSKMTVMDRTSPGAWRAFQILTDIVRQAPNPETKFENIFNAMALDLSFILMRRFLAIKKTKREETDNDSEKADSDREHFV